MQITDDDIWQEINLMQASETESWAKHHYDMTTILLLLKISQQLENITGAIKGEK